MIETFKNVSIFLIFIVTMFLWNAVRIELGPVFDFDHGPAVLMVFWCTGVVVIFHLLYYSFGQWPEKISYLGSLVAVLGAAALFYFKVVPLGIG